MYKNISIVAYLKDGTIIVYIRNKKYTYVVEAIHHDRIKRLARYKPFTALNEIKRLNYA